MTTELLYQLSHEIRQAIITIRRRWFHSLLSVLGIAISVASIIVMISISVGTQKKILKSIKALGMHTIRIVHSPLSATSPEFENLSSGLLESDYQSISASIGERGIVSHTMTLPDRSVLTRSGDLTTTLYRSDEHFLEIEKLKVLHGRPILHADIIGSRAVAIISEELSHKAHLRIAETLVYDDTAYDVVGISSGNDRLKSFIYLPLGHTEIIDMDTAYDRLDLYLHDTSTVIATAQEIDRLLEDTHHGIKDYRLTVPLEIVKKKKETQKELDLVLFVIAMMSLLSGGISVMNIMLSNIAEQTREIGLRFALGATRMRIIRFILIHAIVLSLFAAIIGSLIGYLLLLIITLTAKTYIVFSLKAFLLASMMAIVSGILFGLYPALRASKITPMRALREY